MGKRSEGNAFAWRAGAAIAAFIALAALWHARPAVAADVPPLLTLPPGANATLVLTDRADRPSADAPAFTARVPVSVVADKDVDVRLIDVAYKDARSAEIFPRFKVELDRPAAPAGAALVVSYGDSKLWPGIFALTLRVGEKPKNTKEKAAAPMEVVLNVQVPAPQLTASTKIALSLTIDSLGSSSAPASVSSAGHVQLAERAGKIGAFDLQAVAFHDASSDADTGTGKLTFDPARLSVPAGAASSVTVTASGAFPLGVTKGKIEWMSASLAAPLAVPFEVKVTRSKGWIVAIALAGVLLGFLLRKLLMDFQGKLAARDALTLSLLQAGRALEGRADVAYRQSLSAIVTALDDALAGDDTKNMLEVAKKKADEIKVLSDALEARFEPARAKLADINAIVDQELHLPKPVAALVDRLREQTARCNDLLQQRDMSAAEALQKRMLGSTVLDLVRGLGGHVAQLDRFLSATAKAPFPMSEDATQLLRDLASDVARVGQALDASAAPTLADVRTLVLRADALWLSCLGLADNAPALSSELCSNAAAQLQASLPTTVQAFEAVAGDSVAAAQQFARDLRALGEGPVFGGHPDLVARWLDFLKGIAPTALPATLQPLLERAAWREALRVAIQQRVEADRQANLPVKASLDAAGSDDSATTATRSLQLPAPSRAGIVVDGNPPALRPDDLVRRREALANRVWQTELVRSLGLAAVFVVVTYFLYGDAWVGTYKEIGTLFALAFGLDLTSDGIVAALKKT